MSHHLEDLASLQLSQDVRAILAMIQRVQAPGGVVQACTSETAQGRSLDSNRIQRLAGL